MLGRSRPKPHRSRLGFGPQPPGPPHGLRKLSDVDEGATVWAPPIAVEPAVVNGQRDLPVDGHLSTRAADSRNPGGRTGVLADDRSWWSASPPFPSTRRG